MITCIYNILTTCTHTCTQTHTLSLSLWHSEIQAVNPDLVCNGSEATPPSSSLEGSWPRLFSISLLHGDLRGLAEQ